MRKPPIQVLAELVQNQQADIYRSPRRLKGYLLDLCPMDQKTNIKLIIGVLEEGIVEDILSLTPENTLGRSAILEEKYRNACGYSKENTAWAIGAWAAAFARPFSCSQDREAPAPGEAEEEPEDPRPAAVEKPKKQPVSFRKRYRRHPQRYHLAIAAGCFILISIGVWLTAWLNSLSRSNPAGPAETIGYDEPEENPVDSDLVEVLPGDPAAVDAPFGDPGNTLGNLLAGGYAAESNGWIYFTEFPGGVSNGLWKVRSDGTDRAFLSEDAPASINVCGDWVYYADADAGIVKIQTDGTGREIVSRDRAVSLITDGNWIYYLGGKRAKADPSLWRIRTDGTDASCLAEGTALQNLAADEEWVYYLEADTAQRSGDIYRIKGDGTQRTKINLGRDKAAGFALEDGWIYYQSGTGLYRVAEGQGRELLADDVDSEGDWNLSGGWVYYRSSGDGGRLCKAALDGSAQAGFNWRDAHGIHILGDNLYVQLDLNSPSRPEFLVLSTDGDLLQGFGGPVLEQPEPVNTYGNLSNGSFAAQVGDWVYYVDANASLGKLNLETGESRELAAGCNGGGINVSGNWVYFLKGPELYLSKVRTEGTGETLLLEETIASPNVHQGWIYYIGDSDSSIYRIRTDGTDNTRLLADLDSASQLCAADGWLYYLRRDRGNQYAVCRTDLDGGQEEKVIREEYLSCFTIADGWIYYATPRGVYRLSSVKTGLANEVERITEDGAAYLNVSGGWVYYTNLNDGDSIWKIQTDLPRSSEQVAESPSSCLNIIGDTLYYLDSTNPDRVRLRYVRTDGTHTYSFRSAG